MNLYLVRLDGTYARYTGVVADPELTPLHGVAGAMEGTGEPYRDIPVIAPVPLIYANPLSTTNTGITLTNPIVGSEGITGTINAVEADDVSHTPPRQAVQTYTFWKFTFATVAETPTYAYAEFRRGDIISNTAPNTDPTP